MADSKLAPVLHSNLQEAVVGVRHRAQLFVEEMSELGMRDLVQLDSNDAAEWVDVWARGQKMFDAPTAAVAEVLADQSVLSLPGFAGDPHEARLLDAAGSLLSSETVRV